MQNPVRGVSWLSESRRETILLVLPRFLASDTVSRKTALPFAVFLLTAARVRYIIDFTLGRRIKETFPKRPFAVSRDWETIVFI